MLVVSLGYGLGGPMMTVAMLSLALNLVLTGVFILVIQRLVPTSQFRLIDRTGQRSWGSAVLGAKNDDLV